MNTPRRPLAKQSINISSKKELSLYIRGKIVGKAKKGKKPAQIAKELNIPDSIV
jgi:hypothetical protein